MFVLPCVQADRLSTMDDFKDLVPVLSLLERKTLDAMLNPPTLADHMRSILNAYQVTLTRRGEGLRLEGKFPANTGAHSREGNLHATLSKSGAVGTLHCRAIYWLNKLVDVECGHPLPHCVQQGTFGKPICTRGDLM